MKALFLRRPGSILDLQINETECPEPSPGHALVRIAHASLNPLDYKHILSGHSSWHYPHVPGLDGAGTVEALHRDDRETAAAMGIEAGTRVVFHQDYRLDGTFADFCLVPLPGLARIPDGLDTARAATLPCAGLTAWRALHSKGQIGEGSLVLVEGAAGGVGSWAVQLARLAGARVFGTCSPENNDYVTGLGAEACIDYNSESIKDRVAELSGGRGMDVVIETISGHSATQALSYLAYGGSMVCLSGMPDLSRLPSYSMAPSIHEIALSAVYAHGDVQAQSRMASDLGILAELLAGGRIQAMISRSIGLAEVPQALEDLRERHVRGKIVVDLSINP